MHFCAARRLVSAAGRDERCGTRFTTDDTDFSDSFQIADLVRLNFAWTIYAALANKPRRHVLKHRTATPRSLIRIRAIRTIRG